MSGVGANPMAAQQAQQQRQPPAQQAGPVERPQVQGPPPQALQNIGGGQGGGFQLNLPQPQVQQPEMPPGVEQATAPPPMPEVAQAAEAQGAGGLQALLADEVPEDEDALLEQALSGDGLGNNLDVMA